ncbi:hypothetical protein ACTFIR_003894 [Dictyostelium discoideum]
MSTTYKHMVNNQGLLVEEELNVSPFGTPEGIHVSFTVKNNDTVLLIVEKRINDILKPLLIISSMLSSDSHNIDVELISYIAQSTIVLVINAQASLSSVRRNNIIKVPLSRKETRARLFFQRNVFYYKEAQKYCRACQLNIIL